MREADLVLLVWARRIATSVVIQHSMLPIVLHVVVGYVVSLDALCRQSVTAHGAEAKALGRASLYTEVPSCLAAYELLYPFLF